MKTNATRISKTLSYWLRHKPEVGGLHLSQEGWAKTTAVLNALDNAGLPSELDILETVVKTSDKKRFELSDDGEFIRARQGHSIAVDLQLSPAEPPQILFHGTVERFLPSILSEGLKPMARQYVHLSHDQVTAAQVGVRRGKPIILHIESGRMATDGHTFYLSTNGVWLIDHVPSEYITVLT